MPPQGTGSDITRQDANDLLQRLITEAIKVEAIFIGRGSVAAKTIGVVSRPENDVIGVTEGKVATDSSLSFGLTEVVGFKYGDSRSFPGLTPKPGAPRFASALCCVYPDGAQVILFEIAP
jgi:hypothetical protein